MYVYNVYTAYVCVCTHLHINIYIYNICKLYLTWSKINEWSKVTAFIMAISGFVD